MNIIAIDIGCNFSGGVGAFDDKKTSGGEYYLKSAGRLACFTGIEDAA